MCALGGQGGSSCGRGKGVPKVHLDLGLGGAVGLELPGGLGIGPCDETEQMHGEHS